MEEIMFLSTIQKAVGRSAHWKVKQMHLSGEEAEAGLAAGHVSEMDAQEASGGSEDVLNIFFFHPRLGLSIPMVPSPCEYSRNPTVTKSLVAPCSLLAH